MQLTQLRAVQLRWRRHLYGRLAASSCTLLHSPVLCSRPVQGTALTAFLRCGLWPTGHFSYVSHGAYNCSRCPCPPRTAATCPRPPWAPQNLVAGDAVVVRGLPAQGHRAVVVHRGRQVRAAPAAGRLWSTPADWTAACRLRADGPAVGAVLGHGQGDFVSQARRAATPRRHSRAGGLRARGFSSRSGRQG